MSEPAANVTGTSPELEVRVRRVYQELKAILEMPDLPPSVRANAVQALASAWQMVNDLAMVYEMTYDLGA